MVLLFANFIQLALLFMVDFVQFGDPIVTPVPIPKTIDQRVDSVLSLMTVQEKIGQMTQFTSDWDVTGPTMRAEYKEDIRKGRVGSIFNAHTAKYNYELQRIAVEETRMKIPLIFGYDVIHGYKTIFPIPLGEAASWDLKAIEQSASVAAAEAAAAGLHWTFAPMVDISRDARWGRVMEGAGEDTYLGAEVAKARVRGFQGSSFENADKVVACVKHFAAYGAPLAGREYNTVDMSDRMFREIYLPPYAAAVKEGCMTVMTSFNEFDGVPCTGNSYLLRDVLRKELGFKGFVVTDYTAINEMVKHGIVADEKAAGELALNAGVDMDMQGVVFFNYMEKSVKEGKVKMADLDQAVRNILAVKFKLGLFDHPYKYMDSKREAKEILSAKNQNIALEVAKKSIVLLKNEKNTLPLSTTAKIALIGPLADNKSELIGAWSAAGNYKDCVSLEEGLRKAAPNASIEKAKGCDFESSDRSGFAQALQVASKADVIIAAIGETAAMSGEAASRTSISIPGVQEELIMELLKTGKPVVVVLMNGRPLAIPYLADNCTAVLETWFLGTQAGNAIAEVIFGKYNPSGKLTMTFPRNLGQVPLFYNNKNTGRPMPEDANFKYYSKYIDVVNTPQYPFGFGLSYTQFEYSGLKISKKKFKKGESVVVSVDIKNTGKYDGEETTQMYIHDLVGSVTRPVRELKGFQKIFLKTGEKKTISFTIGEKELMIYTRDNKYTSEPGDFDIFIGTDSDATLSTRITMDE